MRTVVLGEPPGPLRSWLERRRALGLDRFDEVWEGEYHVAPEAHGRHGDADDQLAALLRPRARAAGLWGSGPLNLGSPGDYRVPDRAYLRRRATEVWNPSAAIVVEILSPGDESYAKLGFYHRLGVEEILIVDPLHHAVEWYRRSAAAFERAGASQLLGLTEAELAAEIDWPPGAGPERPAGAGDAGPERPVGAGDAGPERPVGAGDAGPERPVGAGDAGPERPAGAGDAGPDLEP